MKVVILCGGLGTRLREETEFRPKPMVPIGGRPILWHIMKFYAHHGFKEFILCLGYKGEVIRDFFWNYNGHNRDLTVSLGTRRPPFYHTDHDEADWVVTMVDTGQNTMTGGRVAKALTYVHDETFLLTYGDGLINSDPRETIALHQTQKNLVTLTAVKSPSRFGDLLIKDWQVLAFEEKTARDSSWINGGYFVVSRHIAGYIGSGAIDTMFETHLAVLAREGKLGAFQHDGFWQCMDTYREQQLLQEMWDKGNAPWKVW